MAFSCNKHTKPSLFKSFFGYYDKEDNCLHPFHTALKAFVNSLEKVQHQNIQDSVLLLHSMNCLPHGTDPDMI
jgi:hypothetical protein